jgi:hypothetical protein
MKFILLHSENLKLYYVSEACLEAYLEFGQLFIIYL